MKIGFGNDYTGIELKNTLMKHLKEKGYECIDYGTSVEADKQDYTLPGLVVAEAILNKQVDKGVLICGTGIGISLIANNVPGIRAAVCSEPYSAKMTAMHNDSNIIAMGARVVGSDMAKMIVDEFFETEYEGGRHEPRVQKISEVEAKYMKDRDNL